MNLEKLKDTARKHEQKEDWRKAIDVYSKAIQEFESGRESSPDLSLYNRVGDLHLKLNDPTNAVRAYERAAELYAEQGFLNNAIALCGKILRVNPGRVQTYLNLARLHARKNVVFEAKRNLIEYLERMNTLGQLDDAFQQVKVFADQFSSNGDIRLMLVELLRAASRTDEAREQLEKMAADLEARGDRAGARKTRERMQAIDNEPEEPPAEAPRGKNDLIFIETGPSATPASAAAAPAPAPEPVSGLEVIGGGAPAEPELMDVGPLDGLEGLELDTEPAAVEPPIGMVSGMLEGLDSVPIDVETAAPAPPDDVLDDLEPSMFGDGSDREPVAPLEGLLLDSAAELNSDGSTLEDDLVLEHAPQADLAFGSGDAGRGLDLDPGFDDDAIGGADEVAAGAVSDDLVIDYAGVTDGDSGFDPAGSPGDEPVALDAAFDAASPADAFWQADAVGAGAEEDPTPPAAELPFIEPAGPDEIPALPEPPVHAVTGSIEELEDRILDDPENPAVHRALADALANAGESARAAEEYALALDGFQRAEAWIAALDATDALLLIEPDSVPFQQKRVELAFRSGHRDRLLDAYLGLADSLVRAGESEKALAVYGRVLEHDPENFRAHEAMSWLTPPPGVPHAEATAGDDPGAAQPEFHAEPEPAPVAPPAVPVPPAAIAPPAPAPPAAPRRPVPAAPAGFVDLGSLIIDDEGPRDTRMKVDSEDPTGDEDRDFQETLAQFKRGIEQNLGTEDYEAHYDLGVAFKEMGLLDEAIAEFQKALRAPDGRLRTSEALGVTFFEKAQYAIAETILRRAVDGLDGGDDEKIGLLYWLGRACEAQGRGADARASYERALAVDIRFMDLGDRIHRLTAGREP